MDTELIFDHKWSYFCREGSVLERRAFALAGAEPHYARNKNFDVKHLKLEIWPDLEKREIRGVSHITLEAINNNVTTLDLDCAELEVEGVRDETGKDVFFEVEGNKLLVSGPRPLKDGEETTVSVRYHGSPRKGIHFRTPDASYPKRPLQAWTQGEDEDSRYWFPCYDFPNDRLTSEVVATVPESFLAISNGALVGISHDKAAKTKTYHWKQDQPHSTYLISLVVGEYAETRDQWQDVSLLYYVPHGREKDVERSFRNTPDMMKFFSERIGVGYPYPKYAQVAVTDFIYGGMENTSATTLTENTLHDERASLDFSSDPLVAHELAHQWFGDLITCKDWSHAWLNEGFATYFEALYKEQHLGEDEFRYELIEIAEKFFEEDRERYRRPIVTRTFDNPTELFDRHLYEKASLVLHMLRYHLGEEIFWKAIRHYTQKFARRNVDTDDFRKALEESSGVNLEKFFEQWFYKAGYPEFKVSYSWDDQRKAAALTIEQKQELVHDTPIFDVEVQVAFLMTDGRKTFNVRVSSKENKYHFPLTEKPRAVVVDPHNWILKSLQFERPLELLLNQIDRAQTATEIIDSVWSLVNHPNPRAIQKLKEVVLGDFFWGVKAETAKTLGKVRTPLAMKALIESVSVNHPKARRAVVKALGEFKDERAAAVLIEKLRRDESYFVEAEAARSLGKTKSVKAYEALTEALSKDSFNDVIRTGVFDGFSELGDERALQLALEYSKYGKKTQARVAAVGCLGKLGKTKKDVFEKLVALLEDPIFEVRRKAVESLEKLEDSKAIPELERMLTIEPDNRVKRRAREAIIRIRESLQKPEELKVLREEVERLKTENRDLLDRVARLESELGEHTKKPKT